MEKQVVDFGDWLESREKNLVQEREMEEDEC